MADINMFRARFPEFSDDTLYSDPRVQLFLDDAICDAGSASRWCDVCKYDRAVCYLAAHYLAIGTGSEAGDMSAKAGPVIGKTAGGVTVTRGASTSVRSDADDFYLTTAYGQQFLNLRNSCFVRVAVANCL